MSGEPAETLGATVDSVTTGDDTLQVGTEPSVSGEAVPDLSDSPAPGDDSIVIPESDTPVGAAGDDSLAGGDPNHDADLDTLSTGGDETITLREVEEAELVPGDETATPPPTPTPPPAPRRSGGFVALVLGGVIAAGIGYGAAYLGLLPIPGDAEQDAATTAELQSQADALASLRAQVTDLAATPEAPMVDIAPLQEQIAGLAERVDGLAGSFEDLTARLSTLENRPILSGETDADTAAALESASRLEEELQQERAAAAARAEELQAEADAAASAAAEAEEAAAAAIAEAEQQAAAVAARAEAEAALGQVQVALETGEPFAEPLATISGTTEVPEGLASVADTGVATLETLQDAFPPLARAALPVALQETAGEGMGDRFGAFVMGQIGGRSVEPREGSDPDAVLSRIEAAVQAGDLETALAEYAALPEGAQAELAAWAAEVEARAEAEAGYAALSTALAGNGN